MKNRLTEKTCTYLSNYERNVLLPILIKGLAMKKGKINAVTNRQIVHGLRNQGLRISDIIVRKMINYIRTNDLIDGLIASSHGYYTSNNLNDFIAYENSLLGRESAIRKVRMSIKRQRRAMFSEREERQLQLF